MAPESIVVSFGANLAATTAVWPTTLGGLQVNVVDSRGVTRAAPIYYVTPSQISYQIPAGTALGAAQVNIGSQRSTVEVAATSPSIYSANERGQGVAAATYLRIAANGVRTEGFLV